MEGLAAECVLFIEGTDLVIARHGQLDLERLDRRGREERGT